MSLFTVHQRTVHINQLHVIAMLIRNCILVACEKPTIIDILYDEDTNYQAYQIV